MSNQKIKYEELNTGFEFTPSTFKMDAKTVKSYIEATEDRNIINQPDIVPPMAVAALAMMAMSGKFELLPGTVHVSQQLEFKNKVNVDDTLSCYSRVSRKVARGKFHILTIGIKVNNQRQEDVLTGEIGFILPIN
jgi:acyl dehydratase